MPLYVFQREPGFHGFFIIDHATKKPAIIKREGGEYAAANLKPEDLARAILDIYANLPQDNASLEGRLDKLEWGVEASSTTNIEIKMILPLCQKLSELYQETGRLEYKLQKSREPK